MVAPRTICLNVYKASRSTMILFSYTLLLLFYTIHLYISIPPSIFVTLIMATMTLARWAVSLKTIPTTTRHAALRSLYNYIGCTIGGSGHPTVKKAYTALAPLFGQPSSSLLGTTSKIDIQNAALLNGIASHVHDYDDTHLATIIHPTGPVASALLAYVEFQGNSLGSDELLIALVAGIEASCKLGLAVWPEHYDIGWHITSTTGAIGAAVGVGKLMHLSDIQMAHAIGIAAVHVIGLREMFGSDTKSFHPGQAAASGIVAALLARQGYTSSDHALEAKRGWANVVAGGGAGAPRLDAILETLGGKWEIESNSFKPFPCGIVCHPAIDAAIQCHNELSQRRVDPSQIEGVSLKVHPLVVELTSKKYPRDGLEGKFSVFHGCAVGLLYGKAGPAQYEDGVVTASEVTDLRNKVEITASDSIRADEAHLHIRLRDERVKRHVVHALGSLEVPMTDEQLKQKFLDQVSMVLGYPAAARASEAAWSMGDAEDILPLMHEFNSASARGLNWTQALKLISRYSP
jgi:aconitate decarboxylase